VGFENQSVKEFLNEPKYTIGDETISSRVLKHWLIGLIFPKKFQFENKKVRTADINPILYKIARFNRVNRKNKKRDKSKKEDLSRCVLEAGLEPTITKLKDLSFLINLL
jgi:hypothetical protein